MWSTPKLMELLLKEGNGFVDSNKQAQLRVDYESYLQEKERSHQHHLLANKLSHNTPEYKRAASERLKGRKHPWQDKINKNPEKIRKTAEKHRGMKRSEETRRKLSEAAKRGVALRGGTSPTKGKIRIYNPTTNEYKFIFPTDELPVGWTRGKRG